MGVVAFGVSGELREVHLGKNAVVLIDNGTHDGPVCGRRVGGVTSGIVHDVDVEDGLVGVKSDSGVSTTYFSRELRLVKDASGK